MFSSDTSTSKGTWDPKQKGRAWPHPHQPPASLLAGIKYPLKNSGSLLVTSAHDLPEEGHFEYCLWPKLVAERIQSKQNWVGKSEPTHRPLYCEASSSFSRCREVAILDLRWNFPDDRVLPVG